MVYSPFFFFVVPLLDAEARLIVVSRFRESAVSHTARTGSWLLFFFLSKTDIFLNDKPCLSTAVHPTNGVRAPEQR